MSTPISEISEKNIGTVESVSPSEIKVLLDTEAPRNISLNAGYPLSFPKINSYLLIPNELGFLVGSVTWLGVEKSAYPKRNGLKDFGLIDLPYPLRKLTLSPVGTLVAKDNSFEFQIGVKEFPSVGDTVIVPTKEQAKAIVQGQPDGCVKIGTCPTAHDIDIKINPDKMFGRHLAILGNTGGGKSCTVASIVRSAINSVSSCKKPNARFIILDPNGEYSKCFEDLGVKLFKVGQGTKAGVQSFKLPAWIWNGEEWCSILQASAGIQKPVLLNTLRKLKNGNQLCSNRTKFFHYCKSFYDFIIKPTKDIGPKTRGEANCLGYALENFKKDCDYFSEKGEEIPKSFDEIDNIRKKFAWESQGKKGYNGLTLKEIERVCKILEDFLSTQHKDISLFNISEDTPKEFDLNVLEDSLKMEASLCLSSNMVQNISPLISRCTALFSDNRINNIICNDSDFLFQNFLDSLIGDEPITVIDLSLVPYEILHLVIAITSRIIFEAHQRYKKIKDENLPTVLVLEEAHTFVSKGMNITDIDTPQDRCKKMFEKIAREGRKFGLGLVLSSQRPSELSETVLSQCNSFILHRITNDRDQELIKRLVPDTAHGILNDLPTLPQRCAIALGAITPIPVLVEMPSLNEDERPQSDDPKFLESWKDTKQVSWEKVVRDWIHETEKKHNEDEALPG